MGTQTRERGGRRGTGERMRLRCGVPYRSVRSHCRVQQKSQGWNIAEVMVGGDCLIEYVKKKKERKI